ncbi:MAG: LPS export ABC transporter periplasmic protein LptC [Pseudohongiellaceae bacterium]
MKINIHRMRRVPLLLVPALVAVVLFIGISNVERIANPQQSSQITGSYDFDIYAERINTINFDTEGSIKYTLDATSQKHFADDTTELQQPVIKLYQNPDSHWRVTAELGIITPPRQITLSGNVEVERLDEYGKQMHIATDMLQLNTQEKTLNTAATVNITTANIEQTATGMYADINRNEVLFNSDGKGRYVPPGN